MKYRPEIDGIRTLAILPVMIYHLKIATGAGYVLPGGFLGVDVFFVISGYLITSLLLREQAETGTVSILRFYQRRARRILPALFLVIFASLAAGWFVMLSSELERLAYSSIAALAFLGNVYWFFELGEYGAQSGLLQPMLHTWSLAIEEQFYLLFPPLVLLLKPANRPVQTLIVFVAVLCISLALSQGTTLVASELSFFSPVSRTWELLFGSVLALIALRWPAWLQLGPALSWLLPKLAIVTLVLMMGLVALPEVNHPGFVTIPVVLATGALICCSNPKETVIATLSSAPFVWIGKLSYSLYLWHFPVFAFGRLLHVGDPDVATMAVWLVLTFGLSVVGYYLVERPFRFRLSKGLFAATISICCLACVGGALAIAKSDLNARHRMQNLAAAYGPNEIDNDLLRQKSWQWLDELAGPEEVISKEHARAPSLDERERLWFPPDGRVKLLIIGNSHSKDLFNALHVARPVQDRFALARFGIATSFPEEQLQQLYASPNFQKADWIVISTRYGPSYDTRLPVVIAALKAHGKQVALVGNTPEFDWPGTLPIFDWFVRTYGAGAAPQEMNAIGWEALSKQVRETNFRLREIAGTAQIPYLSRYDLMCDSVQHSCALATNTGLKTMYDYGHWTLEGAAHFGQRAVEIDWLTGLAPPQLN